MDRNYRQSSLHNNSAELYDGTSFRYYGDVLNPELSNLRIATLAIGFPLWRNNAINVIYHHFQQNHASNVLRNTLLDAAPAGNHSEIGREFSLIAGLTRWQPLSIELIAAQFRAGKAFGPEKGQTASRMMLELSYGF